MKKSKRNPIGKAWKNEIDMDDSKIEGWAIHTKNGKTQFIGTASEVIVSGIIARKPLASIDWARPYRTTDTEVFFRV